MAPARTLTGLSRLICRWIGRRVWLAAPAVLLACAAATAAQPGGSAEVFRVDQIKPGVFVHLGALEDWEPANGGDVANLSFVVGSRCVAVIDTGGTPAVGRALRAAVERSTPLPICYVILTHAHPDHLLGGVAFVAPSRTSLGTAPATALAAAPAPAPIFVASAHYPRTLAARAPFYLNALKRDFGVALTPADIVYPTLSVDKTLSLDLGDRSLTLSAWPTAHTDNDLTVYDPRTRTLFASDLLFVSHLPALDGSLRGWLDVMAELRRLDVDTVVPGHGAVSRDWPAAMDAQAAYLNDLLRETRAAVRAPLTIQQAIDRIKPPDSPPWLLTDRFHRRNVTAAYVELEWEDEPTRPLATPPSLANTRSAERTTSTTSTPGPTVPARTDRPP